MMLRTECTRREPQARIGRQMTSSRTGKPPMSASLGGARLARMLGQGDPAFEPEPGRQLVLSRFAWLRRDGDELIAETSLGPCAVVLEDPRAQALVCSFSSPRVLDAKTAETAGLPLEVALEVASLLCAASILLDPDRAQAEHELPLAVWEFHDLLFHSRSRFGRHRNASGGTYRFLGRLPPVAALPPARWPDELALERPDYEQLEQADPPFARVQSRRRSIRNYGKLPLTVSQLGTFLYRVGRAEDFWETALPGDEPIPMSFAPKPYPAGGALYELEIYAAVRACDGIEPGLYHYVSDRHCLARVCDRTPALDDLIDAGAAGMGASADSMQVLIVLTARFQRLAWKYQSIAYALVLKHVGVVMQTMYLAATAMELAPCAIGAGSSDLFERTSGIDYYEESAVGEFALGSRP